jgi:putative addiction module component (TIGR02574 family)
MANAFKEIETSALRLSEKQRARLASRLLDSLEKRRELGVEQAWLEEIERRNSELESGEVELIPAAEVIGKARKLLP